MLHLRAWNDNNTTPIGFSFRAGQWFNQSVLRGLSFEPNVPIGEFNQAHVF